MMNVIDLAGRLRELEALVSAASDVADAVPEPPTANSLQDILHAGDSYTYNNTTDSLEAISNEIHYQHTHVYILFVIPEAVDDINTGNAILLIELQKLGHVHTITQADALDFPAYGMYTLAVMGSNSSIAWDTANLADLKTVIGLPLLCVDKVSAIHFAIGTDGGNALTKTTIDAISEIEGTLMGFGEDSHYIVTPLTAGINMVSASATYHTLDMSNINITEKVYACADNDPDLGTSNQDVVIGLIPQVLEDGAIGTDINGTDVAAAIGFLGFCYDGDALTTLGKATFYLFVHMMIMTKIQSPLETPNAAVVDLRKRLLGNMKNDFTNTTPLVEWIAGRSGVGTRLPIDTSLYDILLNVITEVDANESKIDNVDGDLVTHNTALTNHNTALTNHESSQSTHRTALGTHNTALTNHESAQSTHRAVLVDIHDTDLPAVKSVADAIAALTAKNVEGKLQMHLYQTDLDSTTVNTYATETATGEDIIIEGLVAYCHSDMTGEGSFTGFSIETNANTPFEFISQGEGAVANMGSESQITWTGHMLLKQGTYLTFTTYGGTVSSSTWAWDWHITFRAVADGGYIA